MEYHTKHDRFWIAFKRHASGPYGGVGGFGWCFTYYTHEGKLCFAMNKVA